MTPTNLVKNNASFRLFGIALLIILCYGCKEAKRNSIRYDAKSNEFIYSPTDCLFQIAFPQKPNIKNIDRPNNPHNISEQVATMIDEEDSTVLSVNFELYNTTYDTASKDKVLTMLKRESVLKGLDHADVNYKLEDIGDEFTIRGSKLAPTDDPNKHIIMIDDERWYFKKNNLFSVSVICPINKYPTDIIKRFFSSLKLSTK